MATNVQAGTSQPATMSATITDANAKAATPRALDDQLTSTI
jgi:hypothetical protein